jgi:predicted NACHT family NTPase
MAATEPTTVRFALDKSSLVAESLALAEQLESFAFRKEKVLFELDLKAARAARRVSKLLRSMESSSGTADQTLAWLTPLRREALLLCDALNPGSR